MLCGNAPAFIYPLQPAIDAVGQRLSPGQVAISADYGMRASTFERLFGVEACMNASEDDHRSAFAGDASDSISAQSVRCMDSYADDFASAYSVEIQLSQGFVAQLRIAERRRSRGRKHEEPSRSNDGHAE